MYATVAISYDFLEAKEDYEYDGTNDYALATLNRAAVTRKFSLCQLCGFLPLSIVWLLASVNCVTLSDWF
jgi:hypothetical protein